MEQHPVPQNIIDVEFKLFGSFTLKQFGKILIGGLAALVIFATGLPDLIKFPLCFIALITGVATAIIPNLGKWINGFIKAIFFSPRYIWIKETSTPELLQNKAKLDKQTNQKVSSIKKEKIDITDLPLDKLFGTKSSIKQEAEQTNDVETNGNFGRVYEDVFGEGIFQREASSPLSAPLKPTVMAKPVKPQSIEEYQEEIKKLKFQLSMLAKDETYKEKEEEIISRINDIYAEIKAATLPKQTNITNNFNMLRNRQDARKLDTQAGRAIFGIVVDKQDNPIPMVNISFVNSETKMIYRTTSTKDGKFATSQNLPDGNYTVTLDDTKHKFHSYAIDIKNQNLPAYKFREK